LYTSTSNINTVVMNDGVMTGNTANLDGGLFYLKGTASNDLSFTFAIVVSGSASLTGNGGIAYLEADTNTFLGDNFASLISSTAYLSGGVVCINGGAGV
jgi:hypothetical protein